MDGLVEKVAGAIKAAPTRPGGFVDFDDIARAAIEAVFDALEAPPRPGTARTQLWGDLVREMRKEALG